MEQNNFSTIKSPDEIEDFFAESSCIYSKNICPNCGNEINIDCQYCPACGEQINNRSEDKSITSTNQAKKNRKKILKIKSIKIILSLVIIAFILSLVCFFGVYIYPKYIEPKIFINKAEQAFQDEEYTLAKEYYDKSGFQIDSENIAQYTYCEGVIAFDNKNYTVAIQKFNNVKDKFNNASAFLQQSYYEYGLNLFKKKEYDSAIENLKNSENYSDSQTYINACYLMKAEDILKSGRLNEAKNAYKDLPENFSFNNISVSDRINSLNNIKDFVSVCGKYEASKAYRETKQVYKRNGSYEGWNNKTPSSLFDYITINCFLNTNGTVTLSGEVNFWAPNSFSSIRQYIDKDIVKKQFSIKNISSIPSTFKIDDNTTLSYSDGKFSVSYSKKDNYSLYFYNIYSVNITYGEKSESW